MLALLLCCPIVGAKKQAFKHFSMLNLIKNAFFYKMSWKSKKQFGFSSIFTLKYKPLPPCTFKGARW